MRYRVYINDDEIRDNGGEVTLADVKYDVEELLRSGFYTVEAVYPVEENHE